MWTTFVFLLLSGEVFPETVTRFTNIKCEVLDPSYCSFKQCRLKVLGRGVIGLTVQAKLLKGPFDNAKVNAKLLRKYNTFQPFLFGSTIDFCKWMQRSKKKISFGQFIGDIVAESSNVNHSCPYENEIFVQNLVLKEDHFKFMPLPTGEYQVQLKAATDGQWKVIVYLNFSRKEDLMKD